MEEQILRTANNSSRLQKLRAFTQNSTSLTVIPRQRNKKTPHKPPVKKTTEVLDDFNFLEHLSRGNDEFLETYIKKHKLSIEQQRYLIQGHRLKLIRLYINEHGFSKEAQLEFLHFMEEKLMR